MLISTIYGPSPEQVPCWIRPGKLPASHPSKARRQRPPPTQMLPPPPKHMAPLHLAVSFLNVLVSKSSPMGSDVMFIWVNIPFHTAVNQILRRSRTNASTSRAGRKQPSPTVAISKLVFRERRHGCRSAKGCLLKKLRCCKAKEMKACCRFPG